MERCGVRGCPTCKLVLSHDYVSDSRFDSRWELPRGTSCDTKDVLLLISCRRCNFAYIHWTSQSARHGFIDSLPLANARHIQTTEHTPGDMMMTVLERTDRLDRAGVQDAIGIWKKRLKLPEFAEEELQDRCLNLFRHYYHGPLPPPPSP